MKEVIKTIAAVSVFALLVSCQMNTADDGNQNETQPSVNTTEYTVLGSAESWSIDPDLGIFL